MKYSTVLRDEVARLESERDALAAELDALAADQRRTPAAIEARANEIGQRAEVIHDEVAAKRERIGELDAIEAERNAVPMSFSVGRRLDPWTTDRTDSAHEMRGRALAAIEQWRADDALKESATATVARAGAGSDAIEAGKDARGVAAHVIRYSHPLYISAFAKYSRDPEGGYVADLTADEARIWRAARDEQRATLQTSGAVLPSPLDPTIVLTNDGAVDPMRSVCRVDTTTAKAKRYITSAGSSFSFDAELAEVSDDTFTETEKTVTTAKAQGYIEASLEVYLDQPEFSSEVAKIIADGKARLEATSFIDGTGTDAPKGIQVALTGGASEVNAAGEALVANDVYGLLEALPPRFRQNAIWQMELSTRNFIHRLYNPSGTEPPLIEGTNLIGTPYVLNSSMDPYSSVNAAATASNMVLIVGDWQNYVILDRIGTSVYFIPPGILQNANAGRPDGRVGWYATWRTGADALSISGFRMLDVATTA